LFICSPVSLSFFFGAFVLREEVEIVYEKVVTPFGNSAKIDAPKRYIGCRAYVIIVRD